jgi:hypothetical protein
MEQGRALLWASDCSNADIRTRNANSAALPGTRGRSSITSLYYIGASMAISARLDDKTLSDLARYCRDTGVTKTAAIERGIELLLREARGDNHPAFRAFGRLRNRLHSSSQPDDGSALKQHLDEKYPA